MEVIPSSTAEADDDVESASLMSHHQASRHEEYSAPSSSSSYILIYADDPSLTLSSSVSVTATSSSSISSSPLTTMAPAMATSTKKSTAMMATPGSRAAAAAEVSAAGIDSSAHTSASSSSVVVCGRRRKAIPSKTSSGQLPSAAIAAAAAAAGSNATAPAAVGARAATNGRGLGNGNAGRGGGKIRKARSYHQEQQQQHREARQPRRQQQKQKQYQQGGRSSVATSGDLHQAALSSSLSSYAQSLAEQRNEFQECPYCGCRYKGKSSFTTHLRKKHPDMHREAICYVCNSTVDEEDFARHFRVHQAQDARQCQGGSRLLQCDFCDFRCNLNVDLIQHMGSEHDGNNAFSIARTEAQFLTKNRLLRHSAMASGGSDGSIIGTGRHHPRDADADADADSSDANCRDYSDEHGTNAIVKKRRASDNDSERTLSSSEAPDVAGMSSSSYECVDGGDGGLQHQHEVDVAVASLEQTVATDYGEGRGESVDADADADIAHIVGEDNNISHTEVVDDDDDDLFQPPDELLACLKRGQAELVAHGFTQVALHHLTISAYERSWIKLLVGQGSSSTSGATGGAASAVTPAAAAASGSSSSTTTTTTNNNNSNNSSSSKLVRIPIDRASLAATHEQLTNFVIENEVPISLRKLFEPDAWRHLARIIVLKRERFTCCVCRGAQNLKVTECTSCGRRYHQSCGAQVAPQAHYSCAVCMH